MTTAATAPEEKEYFIGVDIDPPKEMPQAGSCESCYDSGYNGRTGIFEIIEVDRKIEELISTGAIHSRIQETAVESGTELMFKQALKKVIQQTTTLEEVLRVVPYAKL